MQDANSVVVRDLAVCDYLPIWQKMQRFTDQRNAETPDEIWLLEHNAVFTQGQAGKPEHLLVTGEIPVVDVDRGGQVTYHGPGQLMMYTLINIKRLGIGVRELVSALEQTIVLTLAQANIEAYAKKDAPGVYVDEQKICSVGLRIRKGCSFHGLAFNVNTDLSPFQRINPCGYAGLQMINSASIGAVDTIKEAKKSVVKHFCSQLGIDNIYNIEGFDE